MCRECGHVIAVHQYTFSVDEDYQVQLITTIIIGQALNLLLLHWIHFPVQEYTMECDLCGHGEATVSILPDDPREKQLF